MAIGYTISYTFTPGTTISSSQVNTNFSDNANTWNGLEALTKSFSNLRVDTTPTAATDVVIKSYVDKLNAYRRPVLQWSSVTVVNLETGINGTSGQAQILFPDGTLRTDSTASRINFDITRNAVLSGIAQSGLRTSLSEATNTWYALYAVKVSDSTANFVTVGDTLLPLQANFTTLNSNFGINSWVYLGLIRNGDNALATGDILKFGQAGNCTLLYNACGDTGGANLTPMGTILGSTGSGASVTYSYSAGTGTTAIPNNILLAFSSAAQNGGTGLCTLSDSGGNFFYWKVTGTSGGFLVLTQWVTITQGLKMTSSSGVAGITVTLGGWLDSALGIGANPLL